MPGLKDFTTQTFSPRVIIRKAASYTVLVTDEHVQMNGAYTATLPPLNSLQGTTSPKKAYKIENIHATADVTIQPGTNTETAVADTINSRATFTLKPNESVIITGSGAATNWTIDSPTTMPAAIRNRIPLVANTNGTTAVNVVDANGAPVPFAIDEIWCNSQDTTAATITISGTDGTIASINKGTIAGVIVGSSTLTNAFVDAADALTIVSSSAGNARVTIVVTTQTMVYQP